MSGVDLAFALCALSSVGGALLVVGARRTPVVNAIGLVIAMAGVAGACGLAGAPLIGLIQLLVSTAVAMVLLLVTLALVGTGGATLPELSASALVVRGTSAIAVVVLVGLMMIHGLPAVPEGLAAPDGLADIRDLGRGLFGHDMIVAAAAGFVLLVAILGSVALVARSPE